MAKVRIALAKWNRNGAVASIDDGESSVDIVLHKTRCDSNAVCVAAARKLRKLADDFERLSKMDDAFKEKTQRAASKPSQESE